MLRNNTAAWRVGRKASTRLVVSSARLLPALYRYRLRPAPISWLPIVTRLCLLAGTSSNFDSVLGLG